jgi:transcriptional regulator with XRE-family HTH domain
VQVQGARPNRLRELREARGLKLYDISAAVRADPGTISRWERGLSDIPDETKLELAKFFGVTRAHLMGWDDEPIAT